MVAYCRELFTWLISENESVVVLVPAASTRYTRAHCSEVKLTPLYHIFAYLCSRLTREKYKSNHRRE